MTKVLKYLTIWKDCLFQTLYKKDNKYTGIPIYQITNHSQSHMFKRISYNELNSRQKENYNFQKVAALLADYGFNCMWLNDDWQGADFIACHIDGELFLKVQLKGRLTLDKKYIGKSIYIAFNQDESWFIYPHDELMHKLLEQDLMKGSKSWDEQGSYSWPSIPKGLTSLMSEYSI